LSTASNTVRPPAGSGAQREAAGSDSWRSPAIASDVAEQLSPRAREIVHAARELIEEQGIEALSMRNLGARLGIRAPSIYKHFHSKEALEAALISIAFEEQAALFEQALHSSDQPLVALARAYRSYAQGNPQLYMLVNDRTLNRELLAPGSEERAAAPIIRVAGGDRDLARAAWAFAHGMTILELKRRFPQGVDLDAAWRRGIEALQASAR
jgi:AcrR family transcriptional regulator